MQFLETGKRMSEMKGMCTTAFKENGFRKKPDAVQGQFLTLLIKANQGQC